MRVCVWARCKVLAEQLALMFTRVSERGGGNCTSNSWTERACFSPSPAGKSTPEISETVDWLLALSLTWGSRPQSFSLSFAPGFGGTFFSKRVDKYTLGIWVQYVVSVEWLVLVFIRMSERGAGIASQIGWMERARLSPSTIQKLNPEAFRNS